MYKVDDIKQLAAGKWFGILREFGIEVDESGKHTPCPICGGVDRFRIHKDGDGYFCNQCGAGDMVSLVRKKTLLPFPEVLEKIAGMVGAIKTNDVVVPKKDPSIALKQLWLSSKPIEPCDMAAAYLRSRKIFEIPSDVRFCPACYNSDTKTKLPAMLGVFCNKHGKPISLHRTYLAEGKKADVPKPKKMLAGIEPLAGGAVRLSSCIDHLGIAEGIETALSASAISGTPTWAALSTALLEAFAPPEGVKEVTVFADNDLNYAGHKAAYHLANRLVSKPYELKVTVFVPKEVGDYNDELINLVGGEK